MHLNHDSQKSFPVHHTSRFTDTKDGWSRHQDNKLAPTPLDLGWGDSFRECWNKEPVWLRKSQASNNSYVSRWLKNISSSCTESLSSFRLLTSKLKSVKPAFSSGAQFFAFLWKSKASEKLEAAGSHVSSSCLSMSANLQREGDVWERGSRPFLERKGKKINDLILKMPPLTCCFFFFDSSNSRPSKSKLLTLQNQSQEGQ